MHITNCVCIGFHAHLTVWDIWCPIWGWWCGAGLKSLVGAFFKYKKSTSFDHSNPFIHSLQIFTIYFKNEIEWGLEKNKMIPCSIRLVPTIVEPNWSYHGLQFCAIIPTHILYNRKNTHYRTYTSLNERAQISLQSKLYMIYMLI